MDLRTKLERLKDLNDKIRSSKDAKERRHLIDKLSSLFIDSNEEEIEALKAYLPSFSRLNDEAFELVLKEAKFEEFAVINQRVSGPQRRSLVGSYYEKSLKKRFMNAGTSKKIAMFPCNQEIEKSGLKRAHLDFQKSKWTYMIHIIKDVDSGMNVFKALLADHGEDSSDYEIWPSVAALQTLDILSRDKSAEELAQSWHSGYKELRVALNPEQAIIAEKILKKMKK